VVTPGPDIRRCERPLRREAFPVRRPHSSGGPWSTDQGPFRVLAPAELMQPVVIDAEIMRNLVYDCHLDLVNDVVV
jgi:hypothetical protein